MRKYLKHFFKTSPLVLNLVAGLIFLYLRLVYATSQWEFIWPDGLSEQDLIKKDKLLLALWHNRIAFSVKIFGADKRVCALASPHSDGRIISKILDFWGYEVIAGSTNKNPTKALKRIIDKINLGGKVVITPDGPRGPVYKINSAITKISYKYGATLIPASCAATKFVELNSWDQMIIPKPFGKIVVVMGNPLELSGEEETDKITLEQSLMELSEKAARKI